jgi:Heme oxygenase
MTSLHDSATAKLPAEINSATRYATRPSIPYNLLTSGLSASRSLHTHLNALITSRLPLVLPPHADSPLVYATGLVPFARVFLHFEDAWEKACTRKMLLELRQQSSASTWGEDVWVDVPLELLAQSQDLGASVEGDESGSTDNDQASPSSSMSSLPPLPDTPLTRSTVIHHQSVRLLRALRNLRPTGIARSTRLRNDLSALLGLTLEDVDELLRHTTEQDHELFSPAADAFIAHLEAVIAEKPHVLIAYSFVLYMAVFSGGRWIRSVLSSAGSSFWTKLRSADDEFSEPEELASKSSRSSSILLAPTPAVQARLERLGLSFWFFRSPTDGLDIKAEFKSRLDALESLLTDEQRQDVVEEAREIFERFEGLVSDLDERVGRQGRLLQVKSGDVPTTDIITEKSTPLQRRVDPAGLKSVMKGWQDVSAYAGWALIAGCVGWYAMQAMEA